MRWLNPQISDETIYRIQYVVRKCGHVTEYAVLAGLLWRAWRRPVKNDPRPWQWRPALLALGVCVVYAASDEIHQAFEPTREARVMDVVYDSTGAALGLAAVWGVGRCRRRW